MDISICVRLGGDTANTVMAGAALRRIWYEAGANRGYGVG